MNCRTLVLNYFCQRSRGWVLSLIAAVCVVYLPFLDSPLVFDDISFFSGNIVARYTASIFRLELRWFPYASLAWTSVIFTDVLPHIFRLGNLLLHAANVVLLFFLLQSLVKAVVPDKTQHAKIVLGAWFGAMIFACHPVAVFAVGYLVERSILMATFFSLVVQIAYLRGLLSGQKRWLLVVVVVYFFACFSKEHSVMVLAILAAQSILLRDTRVGFESHTSIMAGRVALAVTWFALLTIAVLVVLSSKGVIGTPYEPMADYLFTQQGLVASAPKMHLLSALTQMGLFFKYLLLWWIPNPLWMSVDMREQFIFSLLSWPGWLGVAGFLMYGAFAGYLLSRSKWMGLAGLAFLYPWLQFTVELTSVRVQEPFVLYRGYLWFPGMMLLFPLILEKCPKRSTLFILTFIALLLVPLAWNRLWIFADNYRLWNDAANLLHSEHETGADRIFYNRGSAELVNHDWDGAINDFQRAVTLSPGLAQIHYELGIAYVNAKRYKDAVSQFDMAINIKQDDSSFYYAKGLTLKRLHQDDLAMRQMEKSCELHNTVACAIVGVSKFKH